MKPLSLLACSLTLLAAGLAAADDKKDKDELKKDDVIPKLFGTWEVTKADGEGAVGALVTFAKDGKLTIKINLNGQPMTVAGTYKMEKGKLVSELTVDGMTVSDTDTIKRLTADEMELENNDGKVTVLKKKK